MQTGPFLYIFVFSCKWHEEGPHSGPKLVAQCNNIMKQRVGYD